MTFRAELANTEADVAALFINPRGHYCGRPDVDAWDESRDARLYDGPLPVVAHPPCGRWCRLAHLVESKFGYKVGDDGGCFAAALRAVRRYGGVLEHPAFTLAWPRFGLPRPLRGGWQRCVDGSWVCEVAQVAYGHRARKSTWLYYVGVNPPAVLDWSTPQATAVVGGCANRSNTKLPRVWADEASRTPELFADALIALARHCGGAP